MPDIDDGKITLAIIQRDILYLTTRVEAFIRIGEARDKRIERIDERLTCIEPTVKTMSKVLEIALYIIVVAFIGGVIWASIKSGAFLQ